MAILTFLMQWSVWLELGKSVQKPLQNDSGLWRDFIRWQWLGLACLSPHVHIIYCTLRNNHWYYSLKIPCDISSRSDKEHWWKIDLGAELQGNPCLIKVTEQTRVTHWMVSCWGFSFVRSGTVIIVPTSHCCHGRDKKNKDMWSQAKHLAKVHMYYC